ncbi:MAG: hemerythrin domain-containing protein [Burkholderiales bacterium]|nr:hemerythrin domain-containing protein [Burkholderiales bacterium]
MNRAVPGFSAPAAGFEVPLEMLAACHLRILHQCSILRRLVPHLAAHGVDAQAREAAAGAVRYFETAAKDHHADEEDDLFPALMESMAGSDAICLRELTAALGAEHRELEAQWRRLRPALERIAANEPAPLAASGVEAMVELYERHIAREDLELLPMAARLLTDEELDRIGRSMRERRGVLQVAPTDAGNPAKARPS